MNSPTRPLIDELLDWIDREIARAEQREQTGEAESPNEEESAPEPRERLRVPSAIPA